MLTMYRRHIKSCPQTSMRYKRCKCPIWVVGRAEGQFVRKSLGIVNWERAQAVVREWEVEDSPPREPITVEAAAQRFIMDCESRHLRYSTLAKYRLLFNELNPLYGKHELYKIGVDELDSFRAQWKLSPISSKKKLSRMRAFFRFCVDRGWIEKNPAVLLKSPIVTPKATLPFSDAEMEKIFWGCEVFKNKGIYGIYTSQRLRAFILLLRHSGLRIGDAVCLEKSRIQNGKLFLYTTQKTGTPVYVPLPEVCLKALENVKSQNGKYFFWTGEGTPKSACTSWQRALGKLSKLSGVHVHAHRFRDTFSVGLLKAGVPLEQVSVLLGHSSIKTTEKHYSPWVRSRQEQLESLVKRSWSGVEDSRR
jgi:integrase/recombinase XerD